MSNTSRRSTPQRRPGLVSVAGLGALLIAVLLLTVPLIAVGQSAPLRDRGRANDPEPTATARRFQPARSAPSDEPALLGDSIRSRVTGRSEPAPPSRRPRPDPAPVSLAPVATLAPAPEPEPAPARARTAPAPPSSPARVWPLAPGTFEISQLFGCVPQLFGYYPVVPGCPAEAPAVHDGLDFAADQGTPIYAAASGWVTASGLDRPSGVANTYIVIQHDGANEGYATEYYHWITTYVDAGDYVEAGEAIAEVGSVGYSTGPHLHFTVVEFATDDRIDPVRWLPASPRSGDYLGLVPGRNPVRFPPVNIPVPDYADPAPPPVPTAQRVPDVAPATASQATTVPDPTPATDDRPAAVEPTAAPAAPTPVPTAHIDRASDPGASGNGRDPARRDRRPRDEAPEPTPVAPSYVPDVPLNPMVTTPVPPDDGNENDGRKRKKKQDR